MQNIKWWEPIAMGLCWMVVGVGAFAIITAVLIQILGFIVAVYYIIAGLFT